MRARRNLPRYLFALTAALLGAAGPAAAGSLDLTVGHVGLGIGNSPRLIGLRLNAVDSNVERIDGVNLTLWNPRPNPRARMNGLTLGLIGPKAGRLRGLAAGGIGATARERIDGLVLGGYGVGTQRLVGLALGGVEARVTGRGDGMAAAVIVTKARQRARGAVLGGVFAQADTARGLVASGLVATGDEATGIAAGGLVAGFSGRMRGLNLAGIAAGSGQLEGIALSPGCAFAGKRAAGLLVGGVGAIAGDRLRGGAFSLGLAAGGGEVDGLLVGGLGAGTRGRARGLVAGSLVAIAPEATGVTIGALNGVILESISLDDFLKIRTVNRRHTGLAIGLVNFSDELHGVQVGLVNIARNNPPWARILPGLNLHF